MNGLPPRSAGSDEAVLLQRVTPIAYAVARDFYLPGADQDDVRQEALIGALSGIRSFNPDAGVPLGRFVAFAVRRQLVTALKMSRRMKHRPLTDSVRTTRDDETGEPVDVLEVLPGGRDPHDVVVQREDVARIAQAMRTLSPLERHWIGVVARGDVYATGHGNTGVRDKRAENAVDRARRKLRNAA